MLIRWRTWWKTSIEQPASQRTQSHGSLERLQRAFAIQSNKYGVTIYSVISHIDFHMDSVRLCVGWPIRHCSKQEQRTASHSILLKLRSRIFAHKISCFAAFVAFCSIYFSLRSTPRNPFYNFSSYWYEYNFFIWLVVWMGWKTKIKCFEIKLVYVEFRTLTIEIWK